jgi:hypothetical protein
LRFAVHRPGSPDASPRSHRMPCGDVPGRVHVGIADEIAGCALEPCLALARFGCYVPARRAALACERGVDFRYPSGRLSLQSPDQQTPPGRQDATVQAGFRAHVPSRCPGRALGGARHRLDVEVFDPDHVEPPGQIGRRLLAPVFPPIRLTCPQSRDCGLDIATPTRRALSPRESALQVLEPSLFAHAQARHGQHLPGRQRSADHHTPVYPHHCAITGGGNRARDRRKCDMPSPSTVSPHPERFDIYRNGTTPAEPYPARFRDPHLAPVPVQAAYIGGPDGDDSESLVPSGFSPCRTPVSSREEVRHSLGVVAERLLLHHLAALPQPRMRRTGRGELTTLLQVAGRAGTVRTPPRLLLHCQVPHVPGMNAMAGQDRFLFQCWHQPVSTHTNIIANPENERTGVSAPAEGEECVRQSS